MSGLDSVMPSLASLEPSPAAIIANFISDVIVGLLQVQPIAVVAFFEVEFAQRVASCI
jgi:hypothetical protein